MSDQRRYRVVGLKDNGEQVVITNYVPYETAAKIVELIEDHTPFAKLTIECEDAT